jgi:hypothetical protein
MESPCFFAQAWYNHAEMGSKKKRTRKKAPSEDPNALAKSLVDKAANSGKNPAAVALGRLGGKKGGPARAAKLSAERRREIARQAARTRWRKEP